VSRTATELKGASKVAILLMQMGPERASKVLREFRESEVAEIMAEVARLRSVDSRIVEDVFEEFATMAEQNIAVTSGGLEMARALLTEALGEDRTNDILGRITKGRLDLPFEFLQHADPRQVLSFLQEEHPQTITLVLAHMPVDRAAMVIGGLPEELQQEVAVRLATMDRTSPEVVAHVEAVLASRLSSVIQSTEMAEVGGVSSLVEILNRSDRTTERHILEGLEMADEELADEVRQKMFVFEDIANLDDRSIQLVLRQVDGKDLAVALKGVRTEVRTTILRNMSERAAQNLVEEIDLLGPVRLKTVEDAQGSIVRVVRALEESGQIVLARSNDEFIE
jgi:flagellar motor switch protein FliG